jgi:hypothetical protein
MTEQKAKLEQQLWNIANTLRGKMDADDFRDYILGFRLTGRDLRIRDNFFRHCFNKSRILQSNFSTFKFG